MRKLRKLFRGLQKIAWRDVTMFVAGLGLALMGVAIATQVKEPRQVPLTPVTVTITSPWVPDTVKRWHKPIETMARRYGIDPDLLAIIMTMESGGYSKADSGQAEGLMQIAPATAKDIARRYVKQPVSNFDIWDPKTNVEFGAAYLAMLRDLYGAGDRNDSWNYTVELVAAAYNGGFEAAHALDRGEGIHDPQTINYSRDVYNMWRERHAATSPTFERWKERGGNDLIVKARTENFTENKTDGKP